MDLSTMIGLLAGFGSIIIGFILEGGTVSSLGGVSAAIIVFGGTAGAIITSFPLSDLKKLPQWFRIAFTSQTFGTAEAYETLVRFAEKARREGLLSLEQELETVTDRFTHQGMQLVIDGTDPEITREILESNIAVLEKRHKVGISVFESAGGYGPTMGIIGTVMGLVMVLGNLSDPEALSHSIAAAFLATLYGVASANLLWLPIATKLKMKDKAEVSAMEMVLDGILSIQAGQNPSILKEKLKTHIGISSEKNEDSEVTPRRAAVSESR
ncbi:flagellar motor protein [Desulfosporosinus sp. BICA1-9]|uniref:flagellar motor protein n=1 Tax=Desulfosporosinus sp. BICA1-9 TaxID=1531958 RepID=UPI00054BD5EB|nr:flagellar motor protein [Desulfosporosinus sp. BICA1-9]KJS50245.1 MAG: flagellar motor protein MotA [Peptococcaceae bacterium BRH_c23]KJS86781.1 MAG: flagellar motor protein MotA [Desulfosporosinus sp. BICA1-9]HBW36489.1 flagellar motor protein [Desulfosporosinus sp.]